MALDAAETAGDLIKTTLRADYYAEHENMLAPKTQSRNVNHDIGAFNAQGDTHQITYLLDHSLAGNVIEQLDMLNCRCNLSAAGGAGETGAIRVIRATIAFRTRYASHPYDGTMPPEG